MISPCGDDQVETGKQQKMFDMLLHDKIMKRKEQTPNADCFLLENIWNQSYTNPVKLNISYSDL